MLIALLRSLGTRLAPQFMMSSGMIRTVGRGL